MTDTRRVFAALARPIPAHVRRGWLALFAIPAALALIALAIASAAILPPVLLYQRLTRRQGPAAPKPAAPKQPRRFRPSVQDRADAATARAWFE